MNNRLSNQSESQSLCLSRNLYVDDPYKAKPVEQAQNNQNNTEETHWSHFWYYFNSIWSSVPGLVIAIIGYFLLGSTNNGLLRFVRF